LITTLELPLIEYGIKTFPSDYTKLAEMEFYLLSDLDFHLIVYHPYRTLSAVCGREPIDPGTFEVEATGEGGGKAPIDGDHEIGTFGELATQPQDKAVEEIDEAQRIAKMFGKGSGKDVGYVEDSILQMAWWVWTSGLFFFSLFATALQQCNN
jgi:cyclin C